MSIPVKLGTLRGQRLLTVRARQRGNHDVDTERARYAAYAVL